jgi:hypothetical protein
MKSQIANYNLGHAANSEYRVEIFKEDDNGFIILHLGQYEAGFGAEISLGNVDLKHFGQFLIDCHNKLQIEGD